MGYGMGGGEKKVNGEPTQQTQLFVKVDYVNIIRINERVLIPPLL